MAAIAIGNMLVINFKKDGLRLRAVDSINMVLGVVQIESSSFDHFRCDKDMSIRVNFIDFNQILSNVTDEDAITIQLYDCGNRQLIGFVFDNYSLYTSFLSWLLLGRSVVILFHYFFDMIDFLAVQNKKPMNLH